MSYNKVEHTPNIILCFLLYRLNKYLKNKNKNLFTPPPQPTLHKCIAFDINKVYIIS